MANGSGTVNNWTLIVIATIIVGIILAITGLWRGVFLAMNLTALVFYGWDKRQASHRGPRIPETLLLGVAALGGSPGAIVGQLTFHHKTAKTAFQLAFWSIVLLQMLLLFCYFMMRANT